MTRLRQWIERQLVVRGHEMTLDEIVRAERIKGKSWQAVAQRVTELSGEPVSIPSLITWFAEYNRPADELQAAKGKNRS